MKSFRLPACAVVAAVLLLPAVTRAGDCCQSCGCHAPCKKVACSIVADKVKDKKTIYVCECEDFCVPGPCHKHGCGDCAVAVPDDCHLFTRTKVIKYECVIEKCVYKCQVVELCGGCADYVDSCDGVLDDQAQETASPPAVPEPAAPPIGTPTVLGGGSSRR